jgi:hypothetical protein
MDRENYSKRERGIETFAEKWSLDGNLQGQIYLHFWGYT